MKGIALIFVAIFSSGVFAGGPVGFGPVRIGMTPQDLESLSESDGVRLESGLRRVEPRPGMPFSDSLERYSGNIVGAGVGGKFKTEFRIKDGVVHSFTAMLEGDGDLERIKTQIQEKYGAPKVTDKTKEEQCIYRNGSNFKLKRDDVRYEWRSEGVNPVITTLSVFSIAVCPSNLRYGSTGDKNFYSLLMSASEGRAEKRMDNPF